MVDSVDSRRPLLLLPRLVTSRPALMSHHPQPTSPSTDNQWHLHLMFAFAATSEVTFDDVKSPRTIDMCLLQNVNRKEREVYSYLEWQLNVEPSALKEFEDGTYGLKGSKTPLG